MRDGGGPLRSGRVHAPTLWVGGAVTAVVAALIAVLGTFLARVFDAPVLAPPSAELLGEAPIARLANLAAVAAIAATALAYVLMLTTPQPMAFLSWIVGLASMVGVVWPYATTATPASQLATSLLNLCIGAVIGSFVSSVAARAAVRDGPPDITPRSTY